MSDRIDHAAVERHVARIEQWAQHAQEDQRNLVVSRFFSEGGWVRPAIIPSPADDAAPPQTLGTPADWVREGEERAIRAWAEEGQW